MTTPTRSTLARYGLTAEAWRRMFARQSGRCAVCQREVRLVIDHEHARGWAKMAPAERVRYVRGLLCVRCNWRFAPVGLTATYARDLARYLAAYERRRDVATTSSRAREEQ